MLNNYIYACFNTVVLVILPFTGWLAGSLIALVTLRTGLKAGAMLLVPAMMAQLIVLNTTLSMDDAIVASILSYCPGYLVASVLSVTTSWRAVGCALFVFILVAMSFLQSWHPELITQQYLYLLETLHHLQFENILSMLDQHTTPMDQAILANYLIGIQAAGVVMAALISLGFARFLQSRMFYPEGFKREIRLLRARKVDLLVFFVTLFAAKQHYLLAVDMLPVLMLFFIIAGLSLWFDCMTMKGMLIPMLVLSVGLGFFPHIMLPGYVLIGLLDTLVNFRLYLGRMTGRLSH